MAQKCWRRTRCKVQRSEMKSPQNYIYFGPPWVLCQGFGEKSWTFCSGCCLDSHTPRQAQGIVVNSGDLGAWFRDIKNPKLAPPMQIPSRTNELQWRLLPNQSPRHSLHISRHTLARLKIVLSTEIEEFPSFPWFFWIGLGFFPFPVEVVLPSKRENFRSCEFYCEFHHAA